MQISRFVSVRDGRDFYNQTYFVLRYDFQRLKRLQPNAVNFPSVAINKSGVEISCRRPRKSYYNTDTETLPIRKENERKEGHWQLKRKTPNLLTLQSQKY